MFFGKFPGKIINRENIDKTAKKCLVLFYDGSPLQTTFAQN
jgi:hypothetical protein